MPITAVLFFKDAKALHVALAEYDSPQGMMGLAIENKSHKDINGTTCGDVLLFQTTELVRLEKSRELFVDCFYVEMDWQSALHTLEDHGRKGLEALRIQTDDQRFVNPPVGRANSRSRGTTN